MVTTTKTLSGLMGLCIGDALGVPVEFTSRAERIKSPVTSMLGYGTWDMPPGTWSDDSSLTFCLAECLCNGFSLDAIANQLEKLAALQYFVEASAVGFSAVSGMMAAEKRRMDLVGTYAVALISAFGGGTLRDVLLDRRPMFWVSHEEFSMAIRYDLTLPAPGDVRNK